MDTDAIAGPFPGQAAGTAATGANRTAKTTADAGADEEPSLVEQIREKGFMAYVEEIHEKKMEELRAQILEAMGLSEEELAELPAEQRKAIEEMIQRKISQYMSTASTMNGGDSPLDVLNGGLPGMTPGENATAAPTPDNGWGTGMIMLQAINRVDSNPFDPNGSGGADS